MRDLGDDVMRGCRLTCVTSCIMSCDPLRQAADLAAKAAMFSAVDRSQSREGVLKSAALSCIRPSEGIARAGRAPVPHARGTATGDPASVTTGQLGEWELYKLSGVFKALDTDKSGCVVAATVAMCRRSLTRLRSPTPPSVSVIPSPFLFLCDTCPVSVSRVVHAWRCNRGVCVC